MRLGFFPCRSSFYLKHFECLQRYPVVGKVKTIFYLQASLLVSRGVLWTSVLKCRKSSMSSRLCIASGKKSTPTAPSDTRKPPQWEKPYMLRVDAPPQSYHVQPNASTPAEYYHYGFTIPFLDHLLSEMKARLSPAQEKSFIWSRDHPICHGIRPRLKRKNSS